MTRLFDRSAPRERRRFFPTSLPGKMAIATATITLGILIDVNGGLMAQLAVSVVVWLLVLQLLRISPPEWRSALLACLLWASAGEIFLSLVWGLYTYRLENIPLFVPPGHVLLFWLGLTIAPRVPRAFVILVPACVGAYAAYAWSSESDTLSVMLAMLFLLSMFQRQGRRLYCVMFVIALLMELYGTWVGCWVWHRDVPYSFLTSANPPIAAGAFYCMLDVLVGLTARGLSRVSPVERIS